MSELGGFARLSLNQQADLIQSVTTLIAKRETAYCRMELYAVDTLFIELQFTKYRKSTSVKNIKYINHTVGLEPYLEQIRLPML